VAARTTRVVVAASFALTLALYLIPGGRVLARPFVLLSTLAHELGHGLAAIAVGGRFEALLMWSDGSGVATWTALVGRLGHATIAAGGLIGPAVAAALCFAAGRRAPSSRLALAILGAGLVVAELLVVRTLFGVAFVAAVALTCLLVAWRATPWLAQLVVLFVGVQLGLSVFSRGDYLFTAEAATASGAMPSDTAQIASALLLPYWFWGALCGAISVAVLIGGFVVLVRAPVPVEPAR
jgi:hypothetical protein